MIRHMLIASAALGVLGGLARAESGLNVVVILDNSGSMNERMVDGGRRIDAAKRALLTVLAQTPPDASVGVALLNPPRIGEPWLVELGPVDGETTREAIASLRAGGPTPLGAAMKTATDALLGRRDADRYGVYKLLIVSDGEATDRALVERYLPEIQARGVLLDVIGVAMRQQHSLAEKANTYRNAADPASLEQAISAVVLGESAADGTGDAGESDFEFLEAIPTEVASATLAALARPSDEPIGAGGFRPAEPTPPVGGPAAPRDADRETTIGWFMFVVFVVVAVLMRIAKAARHH